MKFYMQQAESFSAPDLTNRDANAQGIHLAAVAAASLQLTWNALRMHDDKTIGDRDVVKSFATLQNIAFDDGRIDDFEKSVMRYAMRPLECDYPPADSTSLFYMLISGKRVPTQRFESVSVNAGELDAGTLDLYPNFGQETAVRVGGRMPSDYLRLDAAHPLVKSRNTTAECYTFALSKDPSWNLPEGVFPDQILSSEYRPLDLKAESARQGDIVVYVQMRWPLDRAASACEIGSILHMGVITSVDAAGRPLRAVSKIGLKMAVYEHPVDRVPLSLGTLWCVYRKRA